MLLYSLDNNFVGGRPANLLKEETATQVFSSRFCEIFKNSFFIDPQ